MFRPFISKGVLMARRRLTPNQVEYQKNIRRIQRFIREKERQGFSFPTVNLEMPKRVTKKALETIKAVKPNVLYALGTYHGEATEGEVVPAREGVKRIRQKRKLQKGGGVSPSELPSGGGEPLKPVPSAVDIILSMFFMGLQEFRGGAATEMLRGWIEGLINNRGREDVARMLQDAGEAGYNLTWEVAYKTEQAANFIYHVMDFLPDIGQQEKMDMMDALEMLEDWGSY